MPVQVWIQTKKENVQTIKLILEESGQLNKSQKVKHGQKDGYMILPTNTYHDEVVNDEAGYFQILSNLQLGRTFQDEALKVVYLPNPEPGEAKHGPIQTAISEWLEAAPEELKTWKSSTVRSALLESSPRRWSTYEPMLLLPSGTFQDRTWRTLLESVSETQLSVLWEGILNAVWKKEGGSGGSSGGRGLTNLAINASIPSNQKPFPMPKIATASDPSMSSSRENILRSPSGLTLLHGSFGLPPPLLTPTTSSPAPAETDFQAAFWVSSKQNGIWQTWAPRYTMFSRGNIKEKMRMLRFHDRHGIVDGITAAAAVAGHGIGVARPKREATIVSLQERRQATAVDLYAGIGYFAFSYAAAGFGQVVCWEINPWSVEGLRRGCVLNGWGCKVVRGQELQEEEQTWKALFNDDDDDGADVKVVVFEEGNEQASRRMREVREWQQEQEDGKRKSKRKRRGVLLGDVLHVNCGFLPSSEPSWRSAWEMVCKAKSAWLHLHENVGVDSVDTRRVKIEEKVAKWARDESASCIVKVEHVELVKTFAPGVWHCVFDVHVVPAPRYGI